MNLLKHSSFLVKGETVNKLDQAIDNMIDDLIGAGEYEIVGGTKENPLLQLTEQGLQNYVDYTVKKILESN